MPVTTKDEFDLGPLRFIAERSQLEPAHNPRVWVGIGSVFDDLPMTTEQWEDLKAISANVTNFVPFTMLLTALLDRDLVSEKWLRLVADQIEPGTIHFRPSDPSTKRIAREIVGRLLGLEE